MSGEQEHVPIILDPNGAPLIIPRDEALEAYKHYLNFELTNESDQRLFAALQIALGTMFKSPLVYESGEQSYALAKIEEWQRA